MGIDIQNCRLPEEQDMMLQRHIIKLRQRHIFSQSKILFIPENMTGFTHHQLEKAVGQFINVETIHQNGGLKPGVTKTPYITKDYYLNMDHLLRNQLLFLDANWTSEVAEMRFKDHGNPRKEMLNHLSDQILRYGYDEHMHLTGKDKNNPLIQDDGTIAWLMFGYWPRVILRPSPDNPYKQHIAGII